MDAGRAAREFIRATKQTALAFERLGFVLTMAWVLEEFQDRNMN